MLIQHFVTLQLGKNIQCKYEADVCPKENQIQANCKLQQICCSLINIVESCFYKNKK